MDKEEIINKTKNYVQNICKKNRVGHDWWHIERVYKNAMLINQKEKADEFIITMIVLMHDLYDHKFYNGNVEEALEETLKKLGVYNNIPEEDIKNIINSCENLGFSSNMVTKKRAINRRKDSTRCR